MKKISFLIFLIFVFSFGHVPGAQADDINPSSINWLHTNVSNWSVTSTITGTSIGNPPICINHTKSGQWPVITVDGEAVEGNPWIFAQINGQWYGATYEWLRPEQTCKQITASNIGIHIKVSPLDNWVPKADEIIGLMVSTPARFGPDGPINERSNIVLTTWPKGNGGGGGGGGGDNGDSDPGPDNQPQILGTTPNVAMPGDEVNIIGVNLGSQVLLTSIQDGTSHELTAALNSVNTNAIITLPENILPGTYNITVINEDGFQDTLAAYLFVSQEIALGPPPEIPPAQDFGNLITDIFRWALSLVGAAIFFAFLYAGFLWFTAAGRTGPITKAKEVMTNAVIGAVILLAAYLILNTINPDLVRQTFILPGL